MTDLVKRTRRSAPRRKITDEHRRVFLENLAKGLTMREAAELTGHPRSSFWETRKDPEFEELVQQALAAGTDVIEAEVRRRAVEGYQEPVIGKIAPGIDGVLRNDDGDPITVTKYSDRLAEVLLKGRRPEYRDNPKIDISNQTLNVTVEDRSAALADVARVLAEAGVEVAEIEGHAAEITDGSGGPGQVVPGSQRVLAEPQ